MHSLQKQKSSRPLGTRTDSRVATHVALRPTLVAVSGEARSDSSPVTPRRNLTVRSTACTNRRFSEHLPLSFLFIALNMKLNKFYYIRYCKSSIPTEFISEKGARKALDQNQSLHNFQQVMLLKKVPEENPRSFLHTAEKFPDYPATHQLCR